MISILNSKFNSSNIIKSIKDNKNLKENIVILLIFFIFSIIVSYPVFNNKMLIGYDTTFFIGAVEGIKDNILKWHQIPYRINYSYGMGNLVPIFYHNTILYITAFLQIIINFLFSSESLTSLLSFIITYFLLNFFSGITMYIASNSIFNNKKIAFASAIFYMFTYVRLKLLYYNGMLGMVISLVIIPIYILSLYEIFFRNEKKWYLFVITASLMFHSHIISTYLYGLFTVILFIFFIFTNYSKQKLLVFLKSIFITFLVNLFLLLPMVYCFLFLDILNPVELYPGIFKIGSVSMSLNIKRFFEMFPDINTKYYSPGLFLVIAILTIIIFLIYTIVSKIFIKNIIVFKEKCNDIDNNIHLNKFIIFLSFLTIVFMFLVLNFYDLSNKILHFIFYILQFRMRFYIFVLPFSAICFPYILYLLFNKLFFNIKKFKNYFYILFFVSISLITGIYIVNNTKNNSNYVENINGIYTLDYALRDSIIDDDSHIFSPYEPIEYSNNNVEILKYDFNNKTNVNFEYKINNFNNEEDYYVDLELYDYPVYKATDDNNNLIKISHGDHARARIYLNDKSGSINIRQYEPFSWLFADLISLLTIIIFIYYIINKNKLIKKNSI